MSERVTWVLDIADHPGAGAWADERPRSWPFRGTALLSARLPCLRGNAKSKAEGVSVDEILRRIALPPRRSSIQAGSWRWPGRALRVPTRSGNEVEIDRCKVTKIDDDRRFVGDSGSEIRDRGALTWAGTAPSVASRISASRIPPSRPSPHLDQHYLGITRPQRIESPKSAALAYKPGAANLIR